MLMVEIPNDAAGESRSGHLEPTRRLRARRTSARRDHKGAPKIQRWLAAHRPAVSPALHPDHQQLAEPRRALVRRGDQQVTQAWRAAPSALNATSAAGLDAGTRTPALCVDQACRTDPGIDRQVLPTNQPNDRLGREHRALPRCGQTSAPARARETIVRRAAACHARLEARRCRDPTPPCLHRVHVGALRIAGYVTIRPGGGGG